jgi:hypothetical protein
MGRYCNVLINKMAATPVRKDREKSSDIFLST